MLNYKMKENTHNFTLLARVNNAGAWKKIQSYGSKAKCQHQIAILEISKKDNAVEELAAYLAANPAMTLRFPVEQILSIVREQAAKIEAEMTLPETSLA